MKVTDTEKLKKAKKRVEEIKGFYIHLTIYIIVNVTLLLIAMGLFSGSMFSLHMPGWGYFTTPFFWGIGLFFHWLKALGPEVGFFKQWEEKKIQEYIEKEESDRNRFS